MNRVRRERRRGGPTQNRLLGMPREEAVKEVSQRGVLYHIVTGETYVYEKWDERDKMVSSGDWVRTPAKVGKHNADDYQKLVEEDMIVAGIPFEKEEEVEEETDDTNYSETIRFRDSNLPPVKKYISTMNVEELKVEAKKVGLDFDDEETRPTKIEMQRLIKFEAKKQKREDIK